VNNHVDLNLLLVAALFSMTACGAVPSVEVELSPAERTQAQGDETPRTDPRHVDVIDEVDATGGVGHDSGGDASMAEAVVTAAPQVIRLLSLGDSYTIGSGGVPEAERWPNQLADALKVHAEAHPETLQWTLVDPELIAHIGWTTGQLMQAMDAAGLAAGEEGAHEGEPYELVTLLIGVNNQYQGKPLEAYKVDLAVLLDRAIALAGGRPGRVVMLSIPDYGVTPFAAGPEAAAISAELESFNAEAQLLAEQAGVHWVDIVDISRLAVEDPTLLAADGLHPSGAMYTLWAERALPVAIDALTSH